MKQCAVCKQRVQGAFYCRLKNMHIDVPDWDYGGTSAGGDGNTKSAECLRGLFLCSVEELEESRGSWTLNGGKGGGDASNRRKRMRGEEDHNQKSVLDTMDDAKNCSLDRFGEDLLYLIASFLPNLQQLVSFCQSSKRSHYLLYKSIHSENLFRGIFLRAFGEEGIIGNFENNLSWKERWAMIRGMRRGLVLKSKKIKGIRIPQSRTNNQRLRQTLGMLHERDEWDAIYYENPEFLEDDSHGVGYFGMEILHLPKPPNAPDNWKPLVALRGDFDGIRILNSIEEAVFEQDSDGDDAKDESGYRVARDDFVSVGDEDDGQVLALIQCDLSLASLNGENICGRPPPCCFIGYASGSVAAVTATLSDEGDKYNFSISASYQAHEAELTALTFVNCSSTLGENEPVLFSADCDGKVYFYPNALNPSRGFSMEDSFMAFVSTNDCPILSLSSTVIHSEHQSYSVLCTGDGGGNIRLWLKSHVDLASLSAPDTVKFRQLQVCKASTHRGSDTHSVTRTLFIHNNLLVTGTNGGDVRIWQIRCVENHTRSLELAVIPKLTLRHELNNIFNGAVEFVATIGDVLLTSGGNDGELIGYDVDTGLKLGSLRCHPGRIMKDRRETKAYSCVVDVVLNGKDGRLITLCRDGMLNQWKFDKYLLGRAFNPNKL